MAGTTDLTLAVYMSLMLRVILAFQIVKKSGGVDSLLEEKEGIQYKVSNFLYGIFLRIGFKKAT